MAIVLPQGFDIGSKDPIDSRLVLTKAEMLSKLKGDMPDNYLCICKDDGKLYIWNASNEKGAETGRFKPYEDVIDLPKAITDALGTTAGKAAMEEAVAKTIPGALEEAMSTGEEAEKIASALFNSEHFDVGLDNKIDISISVIQAIDSN